MDGIERRNVQLFIKFFTPFKEESQKLEGKKYPTLPLVLPAIVRLKAHCAQELCLTDDPTPEGVAFKLIRQKVLRDINEKVQLGLTHHIGAFFHPRFRNLQPLPASKRAEVS